MRVFTDIFYFLLYLLVTALFRQNSLLGFRRNEKMPHINKIEEFASAAQVFVAIFNIIMEN